MADANLDAIVGALPDLASSIDTLTEDLAARDSSDPRAAEIVSQIKEMTAKVRQAASTVSPVAPVAPAPGSIATNNSGVVAGGTGVAGAAAEHPAGDASKS